MTNETFEGVELNGKLFPFVRITESMQPKIAKKITKLDWRAILWNKWFEKERKKYITEHPLKSYDELVKKHNEENPKNPVNNLYFQYKDLVKEGLVYVSVYHAKREWKIIRSVAFQKNFLWKYFKVIPYELRCNVIDVRATREIKKKFDNYLLAMTKDQDGQISSSNNLPIENKEAKSIG